MKSRLPMFRRAGLGLVPTNRDARETLADMRDGEVGVFEHRKPRNAMQHKAYFAMLNNVVEASGQWPSREALEFDIALALKRGAFVEARNGTRHFRPDSRAVASMSKADFERLHDDTTKLLTEWLGCDPSMLREEGA